jgi:4-alpha-glucanotransferase
VPDAYTDAFRERIPIDPDVRAAVFAAIGLAPDEPVPAADRVAIVPPGAALPARGTVVLENGTELPPGARLPRDVPYGYHTLRADDGSERLLLTGPGRCPLPGERAWGWAIMLATLRSARSWGIGDLEDLRRLSDWSADVGAGFVAVSPLGAPNPGPQPEPSPYYPSTRRFGNPLHVSVEAIPGVEPDPALARAARLLNADRRVDRSRVRALKLRALEDAWRRGIVDRDRFETWRLGQGPAVERWASFAALSEIHGPGWQSWPEELRRPDSPAVRRAADDLADRVAFHAWVQWCFDRQLADASTRVRRIADMPVGVDPGGFDAWDWQEQLAMGASVGAPPDRFNAAGQNWGLPPFIPHRLREVGYRPFIDTIRAQLRHAGGLRIDHVLGLFRLWWIPAGRGPADGAYVRAPTDELLEIVAIESHRVGAIVIGEDLGTVPAGVRRALRRRNLLSTRLVYFERVPPSRYPRNAFAAVTTHDLPTVAGVLSGSDLLDQARAGVTPNVAANALLRERIVAAAGIGPEADRAGLVTAVHRRLGASPSVFVAATLEDALGVEERPNLPGTVSAQRDNWSLALPVPIEALASNDGVVATVAALRRLPPSAPSADGDIGA